MCIIVHVIRGVTDKNSASFGESSINLSIWHAVAILAVPVHYLTMQEFGDNFLKHTTRVYDDPTC